MRSRDSIGAWARQWQTRLSAPKVARRFGGQCSTGSASGPRFPRTSRKRARAKRSRCCCPDPAGPLSSGRFFQVPSEEALCPRGRRRCLQAHGRQANRPPLRNPPSSREKPPTHRGIVSFANDSSPRRLCMRKWFTQALAAAYGAWNSRINSTEVCGTKTNSPCVSRIKRKCQQSSPNRLTKAA